MYSIDSREEKRNFYRLVVSLVLPMALQNLINVGVTSADVIMLGKVGETALASSSLAGQVQFIMTLIFFGLTSGAAVLTAQYWGKKDTRSIEKILGISMRIALAVAALFTVVVLLLPEQIMYIFSSERPVIEGGASYLRIVAVSYIFTAVTMVYLNICRSVERVIVATVVYLISLVVNVILNAIFIFGLLGMPAMGVKGAALATLIARICEFILVMLYSKFVNKTIRFRIKDLFVSDKLLMKDFFIYAIPVMINELLWGSGVSVINAVIGHLGSPVVAANSVAQVVKQLAMVVTMGLANATAIMIGKVIGEGKEGLARAYGRRFVRLSLVLGVLGAGVILLVSPVVKANLTVSEESLQYLTMMLYVMAYFVIAQAYNTTMVVGVFRAGGDTKFGLVIDATTLWCGAIAVGAIAAFVWKLPVTIVYMILMSDEILKLPLCFFRYRSYKWVKNVTRDTSGETPREAVISGK